MRVSPTDSAKFAGDLPADFPGKPQRAGLKLYMELESENNPNPNLAGSVQGGDRARRQRLQPHIVGTILAMR